MLIINKIPTSELKGILFEVYLAISDKEACNKVNQRLKRYLSKINSGILAESYIIREKSL